MRTHHVTSRHITSRYCISLHHITSRYYIVSHHIHHITPRHHTYQVWLPLIHTFDRNNSLAALRAGKYSNIRMKGSSNEDVNSVNSPWRTALQATQVTATFGLTLPSPSSHPTPLSSSSLTLTPSHPHRRTAIAIARGAEATRPIALSSISRPRATTSPRHSPTVLRPRPDRGHHPWVSFPPQWGAL